MNKSSMAISSPDENEWEAVAAIRRVSRRRALAAFGGSAVALTTLAGCGGGGGLNDQIGSDQEAATTRDLDVLRFALNLEYLEGEFYTYATTGAGLPLDLIGTGQQGAPVTNPTDVAGPTTGGAKVPFRDQRLADIAAEIAFDEIQHIRTIRSILGAQAVSKPTINLAALGLGFASDDEFVILARALSDVGTSAYAGTSRLISSPDIRETAARILATEAYHMGNIRFQFATRKLGAPPVDTKDQPPTVGNVIPTDPNALAIARTTGEVVNIVRGASPNGGKFFPNGLNGPIR